MATYTKINKNISEYNKVDSSDEGWFAQGWFEGWFDILHTKISKSIASYTKVNK